MQKRGSGGGCARTRKPLGYSPSHVPDPTPCNSTIQNANEVLRIAREKHRLEVVPIAFRPSVRTLMVFSSGQTMPGRHVENTATPLCLGLANTFQNSYSVRSAQYRWFVATDFCYRASLPYDMEHSALVFLHLRGPGGDTIELQVANQGFHIDLLYWLYFPSYCRAVLNIPLAVDSISIFSRVSNDSTVQYCISSFP